MLGGYALGTQPLGTAVHQESGSIIGQRIGGRVLSLANKVTETITQRVALGQNVLKARSFAARRIGVGQRVRLIAPQVVAVGQTVQEALSAIKMPFKRSYRGESYTIEASLNGVSIGLCNLASEISITSGEDEATVLQMQLKPREERGESIDLYQFSNKELIVNVVFESGYSVRLFTGIVDACGAQDLISGRRLSLSATDARERKINQQPRSWIERIGHFSELVFKKPEEYETQAEEVVDRLSTIPYSIEWYEGNPTLTAYKPKARPDFVIGPCVVLTATPPALGLTSSERHVNVAELTLQIQSQIAYQRDMNFYFDSGYTICDYFTHSYPPPVAGIQQAAEGAGWLVSRFIYQGLLPNQTVRCTQMSEPQHWGASKREYINEKGQRAVDDFEKLYVHKGSWLASKRWLQPVEEKNKVILKHNGSIERFGEQKKQYVLSISHDLEKIEDKEISAWEEWTEYKKPSNLFEKITGGYARWLNRVESGMDDAIRCQMSIMAMDMLKSHRDECSISMRFAPEIDLRHTVEVDIPQLKLSAKVAAVTHVIDVARGRAETELTLRFFANGTDTDQTYIEPSLPHRGTPKFFDKPVLSKYLGTQRVALGTVEVDSQEEADALPKALWAPVFLAYKAEGSIVREYPNVYRPGIKLYKFDEFIVRTPDIEEESTETMEISHSDQVFEIGIPSSQVEVYL